MLWQVLETIEKSMSKRMIKIIVDAERNRRTLEKRANQLSWFEGGASSNSTKRVPTTTPNGTTNVSKWEPKSMQHRAGAAEAFGECSGRPKRLRAKLKGVILGFILEPVVRTNWKIWFEKASQTQCKDIMSFEAKRGPKMRSKFGRKSKIFLNGPCWVVFRRS